MGYRTDGLLQYQPVPIPSYFPDDVKDDQAPFIVDLNDERDDCAGKRGQSLWKAHSSFCQKHKYIVSSLTLIVLGCIIALILVIKARPDYQSRESYNSLSADGLPLSCGKTNEEARQNGCVFDMMAYAWTPPACFESDLAMDGISEESPFAAAHKAGVFKWYGDPDGNETLPQDPNVLSARYDVWSTNNWHESHCLYFWRLLARAVNRAFVNGFENTYILSEAIYYPHTEHCNIVLAERTANTSGLFAVFGARRIYGECVKLDSKPTPYLEHGNVEE